MKVQNKNTEFVGYSTPRGDVFLDMIAPGGSFEDYQDSYDVRINDFDEVYRHNKALKEKMDTKWQEILANKGFDQDDKLGLGTIILIAGVGILLDFLRRKDKHFNSISKI